MKKISVLLLSMLVVVFCGAQQVTQPRPGPVGSWRLIGSTQANFTADHDAILVRGPSANFRFIKFKVTNAPITMIRMVITYGNGAPENIETRWTIPQGGESRQINLPGIGQRVIRRIDFWYETRGILRGKANVTVFGLK